ncbi:amidohydrolase family protein [Phycicoccus sp. BSK3Z-2]|uniref:Amidohydrolase family protein n=1 Tax=Phycicoccus avicenniae TaxID=2828860 RepID=A0A941D6D6_9MICO|nr:amidohydrolase family protein [Phycicoccus avicenniae]MBR7742705.1 amidohydrolase family protein [Phycicoccus avicenniae]
MATVVIESVSYVVTVDDADTVLRDVDVVVEDGVVTRVGDERDGGELAGGADGSAATVPSDDVTVLDGRGRLVMPGLVNLHTHLPMTLLRGLAEDVDLQGFLTRVWAAEGAVMDPDTVELGATLGALESLLGGCTTQLDMYFHHDAAHRGAVAAGSRHVIGPVFMDGPGPDGLAWEERIALLRAWRTGLLDIGGPEVPLPAMPHATYTCSPEHLAEVALVLREVAAQPAPGSPAAMPLLTTHVSENAAENADVRERYDATPTEILDRAGWLAGDVPFVAGHGVHTSPSDHELLVAGGGAVAHCAGSNQKLASGALHWEQVRGAGVRLGIGTDGCSSSNDLDMWQAMRQAALLARLTSGRPDVGSAHEVLRAATIDGARALGLGGSIGSVEAGKRGDLVVLDLRAPHLTPVHDVTALLVFAAGRSDVEHVLVDGELVVRDRRSTRLDTADVLARAAERGALARAAAEDAS